MELYRTTISTPLGDMLALASDEGLCALEFTSGLSRPNKDQIPERGARMARRDDRAYREYVREEQRSQPGCPARKMVFDRPRQATIVEGPNRGQERLTRLNARLGRWFPAHQIVDRETPTIARTRDWLEDYFDGTAAEVSDLPLDMRGAAFEKRVWSALRTIPPGQTTSYGAIARALGRAGASRAVGAANGANPIAIIVPCHRVIGSSGSLTGYGGGLDRKTWLIDHERRWRTDLQRALF